MENEKLVRILPGKGAIGAALRDAEPNTTFLLSAGTYVELDGLFCNVENISILGFDGVDSSGLHATTIIGDLMSLHERPFMHVTAKRFLVRNVNIEVSSRSDALAFDNMACILISKSSEAVFDHCRVSSGKSLTGISIQNSSKPSITYCEVTSNKW